MQNYSDLVLFNGQPLAGASVSVLNYPSGSLATIYIDNGITTGPNPITTNALGRYNFYAANGRYSLQIAYPNTTTQTILDFPLEDDPSSPSPANITSGTIANVAISNSTATNLTVSNSSLTNTTAVTQGPLDNSTLVATDAFVANQIVRSKATTPVVITGGTYNLNVTGTGLMVVVTTSGGVITNIPSVPNGGSGYAVGDVIVVIGGNNDGIIRVTGVTGGVVNTVQILYGGTSYGNGNTAVTAKAGLNGGNIITLTGALTSNATIIFVKGTVLSASSRIIINNNTTGAFTVSAFMSNGSGGTTGSGVVVPQGSNNSTAMILETDGVTDVWCAVGSTSALLVNGTMTASGAQINGNEVVTGTITPSQTNGIVGTTAANNANAGSWGEFISATAGPSALTTAVVLNLASISLTAGDWDVNGIIYYAPGTGATMTGAVSATNSVSATLPAIPLYVQVNGLTITSGNAYTSVTATIRYSIAATTTVFLLAEAVFSGGACNATGAIRARRVR